MPETKDHEYVVAVTEYLREHGPSDTLAMRMAGLEIPVGLLQRMYQRGIVTRVGKTLNANSVRRVTWGLK